MDGCPDDANKLDRGACGCGVSDDDSDGDGAADCQDSCAGDPEKIDPGACGCGQADVDGDADGLVDCDDACPGSAPGVPIDANGCSGVQVVEVGCGDPADGRNFGEYLKCVTDVSGDAVDQGLLTEQNRGEIISAAARARAGRP